MAPGPEQPRCEGQGKKTGQHVPQAELCVLCVPINSLASRESLTHSTLPSLLIGLMEEKRSEATV